MLYRVNVDGWSWGAVGYKRNDIIENMTPEQAEPYLGTREIEVYVDEQSGRQYTRNAADTHRHDPVRRDTQEDRGMGNPNPNDHAARLRRNDPDRPDRDITAHSPSVTNPNPDRRDASDHARSDAARRDAEGVADRSDAARRTEGADIGPRPSNPKADPGTPGPPPKAKS